MAARLAWSLAEFKAGKPFLRLRLTDLSMKRWTASDPAASVAVQVGHAKLRTPDELSVVTTWKMLFRLIFQGYYNRMHEMQLHDRQLYGPIYRTEVGNMKHISLSSVELVEELLRKDEKFPSRGDMSLWTDYRDLKGLSYGPFTEEGEKWYNLRAVLNKRMLHPKDSVKYDQVISQIVADFIKRMHNLRRSSPTGDLVTNLSNELYLFALEGISSILFERRIGCLENEIPAETQEFIDSIALMFSYSMMVVLFPKWARNILPFWGHYVAGWDGIFKFAGKLIDIKVEELQNQVDSGREVEGAYLTYLLSSTNMSVKEVYGSLAELLLAGVDTTSNTVMWTLYLLSRDPEAQDTLYREVVNLSPGDRIPTAQDVNQMSFLKAVVKETLRMYPVVPVNARIMSENDVVIGGYFFPKKTTFTLCHYAISYDEKTFPEPWKFKPERWLRDGRVRPNPFGSIPFGFGVRGCVGRRIAELEMYMLLAAIIKQFEVRPDPGLGEVKTVNRTVLVPDRQVSLNFLERKTASAQ
ncbi:cytochrome P450 27C1 [Chanos chanos]|uniref:Cytochrome P450 27C1 n=1 Tax=Chanos chanos TaxID=29144 RepID=A0A6J2WDE4_CHACN|nr:cytochrome P450 27C1 [Chanos chanos]